MTSLALISAVLLVAARAHGQPCSGWLPQGELQSAPRGARVVACESWDGIVDRDTVFDGPCTFYGQVRFAAPAVTLDCRGGAVDGSRIREVRGLAKWSCPPTGCRVPGITVIDRSVPLDEPLGLGTPDELTHADPSVDGIVIQNCEVRGFSGQGISIRRFARRPDPDGDGSSVRWDEWWSLHGGDPARLALRHRLAPRDVTLRQVTVRDNGHVGVYVWPYSEGTRIERSRIEGNALGGIYLDAQSRGARIEGSVVLTSREPALQIDSSPENVIAGSCIAGTSSRALGVLLFRNCGEAGTRRWYEARGNRFEQNLFARLDVGIWMASRQGLTHVPDRPPRDCIDVPGESVADVIAPPDACFAPFWWTDPAGPTRRFRDHAPGNAVVGNRFDGNVRGVIVWDDENVVRGNELRDSRLFDVCVGQSFREVIGEPLRGVRVEDNVFVRTTEGSRAPHLVDAHHALAEGSGNRYELDASLVPEGDWGCVAPSADGLFLAPCSQGEWASMDGPWSR